MSQWQREVCKVGITIQGYKGGVSVGWLGDSMKQAALSLPNNSSAFPPRVSMVTPVWAGDLMKQKFVLERTRLWGYSRYPYDTGGGTYEHEFDLHGVSNTVNVHVAMMHIWRASDKGMDQGATAGYMSWKDIQIYDTAGNLIYRALDDGKTEFTFTEWNWQHPETMQASFNYTHSAPIGRVYVNFYIGPGSYAAHDVGDRSPGAGFNPSIPIGEYYPRNLNEISSDSAGNLIDPVTGYLRPLLQNWSYGAWWHDFGTIYEDHWYVAETFDLSSMSVARTLKISSFTMQGYKDKYDPHATMHLYMYLNGVQVYHAQFYPWSDPSILVNSANRIVKKVFDISIPIPAGAAVLTIKAIATNSNEQATSFGWASAKTSF